MLGSEPKRQKFFGSFFQKRTASLIVVQYPFRGPFKVLILPAAQRPQKQRQGAAAQRQAEQNEPHQRGQRAARKALANTSSELLDMAAAASQGVMKPHMASGTMIAL